MVNKSPSVSVFFPFLNDWGTVGSLICLAAATVSQLTDDWEVIIVNDGSNKQDREALEFIRSHLAKQGETFSKRIRIIDHEKNRGYGGALKTGFANATKDLIFYTDCDAQYDPRELIKLYEALRLRQSADPQGKLIGMVNGYKIRRSDPWYRTVAGRIYHHLVRFAFRLPIRDTDCDFRLIRREIFDPSASSGRTAVRLFESTGTICVELVHKIDHEGYKIVEVPVHHFFRTSGKSQFFNFGRLFTTGTNLLKLWWKLMILKEYHR